MARSSFEIPARRPVAHSLRRCIYRGLFPDLRIRLALVLVACAGFTVGCATVQPDRSAAIAAALAAPDRPAGEVMRDADRHAAQLLAFSRVAPGEQVLDIGAGGGYFTRLLSSMVGPAGHVTAQDAPVYVRNIAANRDRLLRDRSNVSGMLTPFEGLEGDSRSYDLVTIVLMYHDIVRLGDRQRMNQRIADLLKPGGRVLIVDHAAPAGSGLRDSGTLHRIDPELVRSEMQAAGLRGLATSDMLANPGDDMSLPAFDPKFRWRTNQFVLLFERPR